MAENQDPPTTDSSIDQFQQQLQLQAYTSPLPPPEIMAAYEHLMPGSFNRILKMAEKQQDHRHKKEASEFETSKAMLLRGQWFGFTFIFTLLIAAFILVMYDKNLASLGALLTASATVIAQLMYRREKKPLTGIRP